MFCGNCGQKLEDSVVFCPYCGQKVEEIPPVSNVSGNNSGQKKNWKDYFTSENIERYAPIAAFFPLVMSLIVGILGGLLFLITDLIGVGEVIASIFVVLMEVIFCIGTLAATAGLIYVIVKGKNVCGVWVWIAPAATLCAFISCLGIVFSWGAVSWIFGIAAVIVGIEMLSRITIAGNAMETPMDPKGAFDTYGKYYKDYKEKFPSTKDLERAGVVDPENSYFDGMGIELLGYILLSALVSVVTCGIAMPWMVCMIYRWRLSHTVINGKRLTFTGTGGSLLGHWILWSILTVITCGIYGFFFYVALKKWELKHTFIDGEPVVPDSESSYFDGNSFEYFGYSLLSGLLLCLTCSLAYPWVMCMLQKWETKHQIINGRRLVFSGSGLGFLGEYIIIVILSLLTCGIYTSWGIVRMNKYVISHTDFVD